MKMIKIAPAALTLMGSALLGSSAFAEAKLGVGSSAPALKVAKWVKGTPVKAFEKGKVYVVEFWATWCGPCKVSIPHLTDMAKKYKGKATFTGVSVWETQGDDKSTAYMTKVADFVKTMGAKMNYNVAVDGVERTMAKTWMEAAEQDGIPTAFVIGRQGKVVWIGHPMDGLDEVLDQVVADKFDAAKAAEKARKDKTERDAMMAEQKKLQGLVKEPAALAQDGKFPEALEKLDGIIQEHPQYADRLTPFRFNLLLRVDGKRASAAAQELSKGAYQNNAQGLNQVAWQLVDDASMAKDVDYNIAVEIAQKAVDLTKNKDGMILDTLAYAYFKAGNVEKAIETEEKAVKLTSEDKNVPDEAKKEIKDRLEMMKKKK